jgi:hypothetical protein
MGGWAHLGPPGVVTKGVGVTMCGCDKGAGSAGTLDRTTMGGGAGAAVQIHLCFVQQIMVGKCPGTHINVARQLRTATDCNRRLGAEGEGGHRYAGVGWVATSSTNLRTHLVSRGAGRHA